MYILLGHWKGACRTHKTIVQKSFKIFESIKETADDTTRPIGR